MDVVQRQTMGDSKSAALTEGGWPCQVIRQRGQPMLILLITLVFASLPVRAAEFCVDTITELQNALTTAGLSAGDDAIHVVQGNYVVSSDIDYHATVFGGSLSITGGYVGDCSGGVQSRSAASTRFVASPGHEFRIDDLANDDFSEFSNLRLDGFDQVRFAIAACGSGTATLRLFNIDVRNGGSVSQDALVLRNLCGDTRGYNVLVANAEADGLSMVADSTSDDLDMVNLTSLNNGGRGIKVVRFGTGTARLWNSIVYGNDVDLYANAGGFAVESSIFQSIGGAATVSGSNNLSIDPQLDAEFYPVPISSPALDNGTQAIAIGLATTDLGGGARIAGLKVDRGAFELGSAPEAILTVTNSNDSGNGSLRDALADANTAPGRQVIRFAIPGSCPRVITLSAALPAITDLVSIEGYTQTGARANDSILGFNAIPCIVLAAGNSSIQYGLRLANSGDGGSEVQGLAFSSFQGTGVTAAAIQVASGEDHRIVGNQFSGSVAGFGLAANRRAVAVESAAHGVLIGGDLAGRNLIGGSIAAGIVIDSEVGNVQVRGNLIGTNSSGTTAQPNGTGIQIRRSSSNQIVDNLISGNLGHGIEVLGTDSNSQLIEQNRIGLRSLAFCLPPCVPNPALPNGGDGVHFERMTGDPVTHSFGGSSLIGNTIAYNEGHGINVVDGKYNTLSGGSIHDNGGLAININPPGVNPIDDDGSQETTAPQGGMNRPRIVTAGPDQITGEISGVAGTYELLIFVNNTCDASGFGEGDRLLLTLPIVFGGPGTQTVPFTATRHPEADWSGLPGKHLTAVSVHTKYPPLDPIPISPAGRGFSEFSQCFAVAQSDPLFANGFE